jgi:hypothetical protein
MGRETLIFLLGLALVSLWMYRNSGSEYFGSQMGMGIPLPSTAPPVEVSESPASPPLTTPVEPPPSPVVDPRPIVTVEQPSDIMGYAQVLSYSLNLRSGPGYQYYVTNVLPQYLTVAVLRQLHISNDGEAWVEVMIETTQGRQRGWVNRQFLSSCHCPTY